MPRTGVIPRDLIPDNRLLAENVYPRISDFGSAIIFKGIEMQKRKKQEKEKKGTIHYSAPEVFLENKPYTYKSDVYSFALIAYELITGLEPFPILMHKRKNIFIASILKGRRPDLSMINDSNVKIFLQKCWSNEPSERPGFEEILEFLYRGDFKNIFNFVFNLKQVSDFLFWFCNLLNSSNSPLDKSTLELINVDYLIKNDKFDADALNKIEGQKSTENDPILLFTLGMHFLSNHNESEKR